MDQGLGFSVQGSGLRTSDLGYGVWGLGFGVWGMGFWCRVSGFGFLIRVGLGLSAHHVAAVSALDFERGRLTASRLSLRLCRCTWDHNLQADYP